MFDNTESLIINLPRFNKNMFSFGQACMIRTKTRKVAYRILEYKNHCGGKVNGWVTANHDDSAQQLLMGIHGLFKDISHQGTLITFYIGFVDSAGNASIQQLSIPIDEADGIEIVKYGE